MVSHLASKTRSPGTCKVAYWTVSHFASKTRSPGTCKVAYWMVGHFANKTRSPGTCKMAFDAFLETILESVGHEAGRAELVRGTYQVAYQTVGHLVRAGQAAQAGQAGQAG